MQTHLQTDNRVIFETLIAQYKTPVRLNETIADSDGVTYKLSTPITKTTVVVSIHWQCFPQLVNAGCIKICEKIYGHLYFMILL
jgi:actin related protein 2/3 complex, subunit 2